MYQYDEQRAAVADELTDIDVDDFGELFTAMIFFAVVAYPESHAGRDRFISAMKSACLRIPRAARRAAGAPEMPVANQDATLRRGFSRIDYRIHVAHAVGPDLPGLCFPGPFMLSDQQATFRAKQSRTQRVEATMSDAREAFRNWKATAPVLHLALALHSIPPEYGIGPGLLGKSGWVRPALQRAEVLAEILRSSSYVTGPQIRLQPKKPSTVRISPVTK